jgi:hypothetical protein
MSEHRYNIHHKGKKIHSDLTEEEYFDTMGNLAEDFYLLGSPNPDDLNTEIYLVQGDN